MGPGVGPGVGDGDGAIYIEREEGKKGGRERGKEGKRGGGGIL